MITSFSYKRKSKVIASPTPRVFAARDIINTTCARVQTSNPLPTQSSAMAGRSALLEMAT
jgi:hypothetical protein